MKTFKQLIEATEDEDLFNTLDTVTNKIRNVYSFTQISNGNDFSYDLMCDTCSLDDLREILQRLRLNIDVRMDTLMRGGVVEVYERGDEDNFLHYFCLDKKHLYDRAQYDLDEYRQKMEDQFNTLP